MKSTAAAPRLSLWGLIGHFAQDVKCFAKEEGKLVKAELTEKVRKKALSLAPAAIGGCVAYTGVTLFLFAVGMVVAYAFQSAGLDPLLAASAGIGATAILVMATGALVLVKGIKAFSKQSLKLEKTIETVENLKGEKSAAESVAKQIQKRGDQNDNRNSKEIKESVLALEEEMAGTLSELGRRVTLAHAREHATKEVRAHPYRWGLVAVGTGFAGSFLLKRKATRLLKNGIGFRPQLAKQK